MNDASISAASVPTSYEKWRYCIEVRCRIKLTPKYIGNRLSELQNDRNPRTREFVRCYGSNQLEWTITWFQRALVESPCKSE